MIWEESSLANRHGLASRARRPSKTKPNGACERGEDRESGLSEKRKMNSRVERPSEQSGSTGDLHVRQRPALRLPCACDRTSADGDLVRSGVGIVQKNVGGGNGSPNTAIGVFRIDTGRANGPCASAVLCRAARKEVSNAQRRLKALLWLLILLLRLVVLLLIVAKRVLLLVELLRRWCNTVMVTDAPRAFSCATVATCAAGIRPLRAIGTGSSVQLFLFFFVRARLLRRVTAIEVSIRVSDVG